MDTLFVFYNRRIIQISSKSLINDLNVGHMLTLTEAFCGFQFVVTHLDGRQLLKPNPGEVIKPDHYKAINEGMPNFGKLSLMTDFIPILMWYFQNQGFFPLTHAAA